MEASASKASTSADVSLDGVREAQQRIAPHAHVTPVHTCGTLDRLAGRQLFFKCEVFQRGGAFKFRCGGGMVCGLGFESCRRQERSRALA